jgi:hypothetical protein
VVELIGHYSNHDETSQSRSSAKARRPPARPTSRRLHRRGALLATITSVLERNGQPMPVHQIHVAAEQELGRAVPYSSLKEALSAHARSGDRRFRRVRYGWYELRCVE